MIEKTLAQVQARDAGIWSNERLPQYARPAYAGLRVPTPDELLARYGDRTGYCIERTARRAESTRLSYE